ncbi:MAG: hypothetical protein FWF63_06555 [Fibromonadales bacterium]|nr:hypothetical protein [Fibromonadales bacterium]
MKNKISKNMYRKPLILALLISLFLEITLFNYTHYATLFTSEHFTIKYNQQEQKFSNNLKNGYWNFGVLEKDSFLLPEPQSSLEFPNLNADIASIYIDPIFIQRNEPKNDMHERDFQYVRVIWADEESSERTINVAIIKDLNFSNYITIAPRGKVSNLIIAFPDDINIAIKQVELNKEIPMVIMPIRLIIVFGISLLLLCLKNAEIRKKISFFCFDYLYDKANFKQRLCFIMLICSMLIFNFLASYFTFDFKGNELQNNSKVYSHLMTNALLKKQLHLDVEVPKSLLLTERPYDLQNRINLGIVHRGLTDLSTSENAILSDLSLYKGKFYSYFGMVPVIVLFAPYKLLTGNYLPSTMGTFLFASIATILLMLLWKQIAQNYLKKLPYFFFLIGVATLYASSLIPIFFAVGYFHAIAQYSALAFVFLGIIMLLQAKENLSPKYLFISSLSFALAVACRPTALFWSILIPVMLWDKRKELINAAGNLLAINIPFIIVGAILARYNYARFDSPFEFGMTYQIVDINLAVVNHISIIGKINIFIREFLFTLFNPPILDITFPFISAKVSSNILANISYISGGNVIVGILCFPIMWFLFSVNKVDILKNFIFAGISISLLNIACAFTMAGISWRYNMDFSWILAIGALICAFQLQEKENVMRKFILKTFYFCCSITILFVFFLTISYRVNSGRVIQNMLDPKIHQYLARTFGVICNVPAFLY